MFDNILIVINFLVVQIYILLGLLMNGPLRYKSIGIYKWCYLRFFLLTYRHLYWSIIYSTSHLWTLNQRAWLSCKSLLYFISLESQVKMLPLFFIIFYICVYHKIYKILFKLHKFKGMKRMYNGVKKSSMFRRRDFFCINIYHTCSVNTQDK